MLETKHQTCERVGLYTDPARFDRDIHDIEWTVVTDHDLKRIGHGFR
jgi:hypothetical protein